MNEQTKGQHYSTHKHRKREHVVRMDQNLALEFFRVFMLFDLFVVQYVTLTLFSLSLMVSTVPAYLQNILIGTAIRRND
jgi:hypothetical protein